MDSVGPLLGRERKTYANFVRNLNLQTRKTNAGFVGLWAAQIAQSTCLRAFWVDLSDGHLVGLLDVQIEQYSSLKTSWVELLYDHFAGLLVAQID